MTISIIECPKRHSNLNCERSLGGPWGPIPSGSDNSMFKCPLCKSLNSFDVTKRGASPYRLPGMVAILGGFSWMVGFAFHLNRRLRASAHV